MSEYDERSVTSLSEYIGSNLTPSAKHLSIRELSKKKLLTTISSQNVDWTSHQKYKRMKCLESYMVPKCSSVADVQLDEGIAIVGKQNVKTPPLSPTLQKQKFTIKNSIRENCHELYPPLESNFSDDLVPEYPNRDCFLNNLEQLAPQLRLIKFHQISSKLINEVYYDGSKRMKEAIVQYLLLDKKTAYQFGYPPLNGCNYYSVQQRCCIRSPVPWRYQMSYVKNLFKDSRFPLNCNLDNCWIAKLSKKLMIPLEEILQKQVHCDFNFLVAFFEDYCAKVQTNVTEYQINSQSIIQSSENILSLISTFEIRLFLRMRQILIENLSNFKTAIAKSSVRKNTYLENFTEANCETLINMINEWLFCKLHMVPDEEMRFKSLQRFQQWTSYDPELHLIQRKIITSISGYNVVNPPVVPQSIKITFDDYINKPPNILIFEKFRAEVRSMENSLMNGLFDSSNVFDQKCYCIALSEMNTSKANVLTYFCQKFIEMHQPQIEEYKRLLTELSKVRHSTEDFVDLVAVMKETENKLLPFVQEHFDYFKTFFHLICISVDFLQFDNLLEFRMLLQMPQRVATAICMMFDILESKKERLEIDLGRQGKRLEMELETIRRNLKVAQRKSVLNDTDVEFTFSKLKTNYQTFDQLEKNFHKTNYYLGVLGLKQMNVKNMELLKVELFFGYHLWNLVRDISKTTMHWLKGRLMEMDAKVIAAKLEAWKKKLDEFIEKLSLENPQHSEGLKTLKEKVVSFEAYLPIIESFSNPGLRQRHWDQIGTLFGDETSINGGTTLESVMNLKIMDYATTIEKVAKTATKEYLLEKNLQKMRIEWDGISFHVDQIDETFTLVNEEQIDQSLDAHFSRTEEMATSPYALGIIGDIRSWLKTLSSIENLKKLWKKCFLSMSHMSPIFALDDAPYDMPEEYAKFREFNQKWRTINAKIIDDSMVLRLISNEVMINHLSHCSNIAESIDVNMGRYLTEKRRRFPKLYFLSDEAVLHVLCLSKSVETLQPFVGGLFNHVGSFTLNEKSEIVGFVSKFGEEVTFRNITINPAESNYLMEKWMKEFALASGKCSVDSVVNFSNSQLDDLLIDALLEENYQAIHCVIQMLIAKDVNSSNGLVLNLEQKIKTLTKKIQNEYHNDKAYQLINLLKSFAKKFNDKKPTPLLSFSSSVDGLMITADNGYCIKYGSDSYAETGLLWLSNEADKVQNNMFDACQSTSAVKVYGTDLDEQLLILQYLTFQFGKELKVQNSDEYCTKESVRSFFKGVASTGCFGCLVGFNRFQASMQSYIANFLFAMRQYKLKEASSIIFDDGAEINFDRNCTIFALMDESCQLKLLTTTSSLFTPLHVDSFDSSDLVVSITNDESLSKVVQDVIEVIYRCSLSEKSYLINSVHFLSKFARLIKHFDNGYSALLSALTYWFIPCLNEEERQNFIKEFTSSALQMYKNLLEPDSEILHKIEEIFAQLKLWTVVNASKQKVYQLYQLVRLEYPVVVLGPPLCGKSTAINCAKKIYELLHDCLLKAVHLKFDAEVSVDDFFGHFDLCTKVWQKGILEELIHSTFNNTDSKFDYLWIVLHGSYDLKAVKHFLQCYDVAAQTIYRSNASTFFNDRIKLIFESNRENVVDFQSMPLEKCSVVLFFHSTVSWENLLQWRLSKFFGAKNCDKLYKELFRLFVKFDLSCRKYVAVLCFRFYENIMSSTSFKTSTTSSLEKMNLLLYCLHLSAHSLQSNNTLKSTFEPDIFNMQSKNFAWMTSDFYFCCNQILAGANSRVVLNDCYLLLEYLSKSCASFVKSQNEYLRMWCFYAENVFCQKRFQSEKISEIEKLIGQVADSNRRKLLVNGDDSYLETNYIYSSLSLSKNQESTKIKRIVYGQCRLSLEKELVEINKTRFDKIDVVLFKNAFKQLITIYNCLSVSNGHLLFYDRLSVGKKSMCQLATHLASVELLTFDSSQNQMPHSEHWHHFLKLALLACGLENRRTLMLIEDNQIKYEKWLEDLELLYKNGWVPDLFGPQELGLIVEKLSEENKEVVEKMMTLLTTDFYIKKFVENVKRNLCIAFSVEEERELNRRLLSKYPNIQQYSITVTFEDWTRDCVSSAAVHFFQKFALISENDKKEFVKLSVEMYFFVKNLVGSKQVVTPRVFTTFLQTFEKLSKRKYDELSAHLLRYEVGNQRLEFAANQITVMQQELKRLEPELIQTSFNTERLMTEIEKETQEVESGKEVVAHNEALANQAAARAQAMKDECEHDLAEAIPALEAAVSALDTLKGSDISMLKTLKSPPPIIKLTLEAVCIMLGEQPTRVPDPERFGRHLEDYWPTAKKVLSDMRFLDRLRRFDKDHISDEVIEIIRSSRFIENPDFDPTKVRQASVAAEGICLWVRAVEVYDRVSKIVRPKKMKLKEAESEVVQQMENLDLKRLDLADVMERLQALNDEFGAMMQKKNDLEYQIKQCELKIDRAERLISGLSGEEQRWKTVTTQLAFKRENVFGDMLILSAAICFLSSQRCNFRQSCIDEWTELAKSLQLKVSPSMSLTEMLGSNEFQLKLQLAGLSQDVQSIENVILMENSLCWSFIIDTKGEGKKYLKSIQSERLMFLKLADKEFVDKMSRAIVDGEVAVVESFDESLTVPLMPLILKQYHSSKGISTYVKYMGNELVLHDNFQLIFLSEFPNENLPASFAEKVCLINFAPSNEEIEERLLETFILSEDPDLHKQKRDATQGSTQNKKQMHDLEEQILHVLTATKGNILESERAVTILSNAKKISDEVYSKQMNDKQVEMNVNRMREEYRHLANYGVKLLNSLLELQKLNFMYNFSLDWFMETFVQTIKQDVTKEVLKDRIEFLKGEFTERVVNSSVRYCTKEDRDVFSLILYVRLYCNDEMPENLLKALSGFTSAEVKYSSEKECQMQNPFDTIVNNSNWTRFVQLAFEFGFQIAPTDMSNDPQSWLNILRNSDNVLSSDSLKRVSYLSQFVALKYLAPLEYIKLVTNVTKRLGLFPDHINSSACGSQVTSTWLSAIESVDNRKPLILILTSDYDPCSHLESYHRQLYANQPQCTLQFVFMSEICSYADQIEKAIRKAYTEGNWLIVNNCHLAIQWLAHMNEQIEQFPTYVHSNFRLFLTTEIHPRFPPSLLRNSTVVMVDET